MIRPDWLCFNAERYNREHNTWVNIRVNVSPLNVREVVAHRSEDSIVYYVQLVNDMVYIIDKSTYLDLKGIKNLTPRTESDHELLSYVEHEFENIKPVKAKPKKISALTWIEMK